MYAGGESKMKVRALTIGVSVPNLAGLEPAFKNAAAAGHALQQGVEAAGWEVGHFLNPSYGRGPLRSIK